MNQDNELRRLEQFVEKLLARFAEMRAEKAKLIQELADRELQIEDLSRNLSSKDVERGEISQRVNKIVEQIEQWELGLEETVESDMSQDGATDEIIEVEEEDAPEKHSNVTGHRSEEEGRVQHNLFSIGSSNK